MKKVGRFLLNLIIKLYLKAAALLYHQFAWAYDAVAWIVSFGAWSCWRRGALDYLGPGSVLEIGFGTGELLIDMHKQGIDVTGLELSSDMHTITTRKVRKKDIHVKRVQGSTEAAPFTARSFNNILSTFPSQYITSSETLKEMRRILSKDGRWVITGLSVSYKSGFRHWLTRFFLEDTGGIFAAHLAEQAEAMDFHATVINHETKDYVLPVLILEPDDE